MELNDLIELLPDKQEEVKQFIDKYKWYEHYKDSALYNKDLCNTKTDEINKLRYEIQTIKKENSTLKELVRTLQTSIDKQQEQWFTRCCQINNDYRDYLDNISEQVSVIFNTIMDLKLSHEKKMELQTKLQDVLTYIENVAHGEVKNEH